MKSREERKGSPMGVGKKLGAVLLVGCGAVLVASAAPEDGPAAEFAKYHRLATGRDAADGVAAFAIDPSVSRTGADAYSIVSDGARVKLTGSNLRSLYYAVYDLLSRRAGCRWYWDGDVVPKRESIDLAGLDVREESRFEYRALRYFAHRGLTRFQAEHWGFEDWKHEFDWCLKRRLNVVMLRTGQTDEFQRAFPDVVPYPEASETFPPELEGYSNRAQFWPLKYRGDLYRKVRAHAYSLGLMMPEDFGTMTHWYSRTPQVFLDRMKPPFLPQEAGNYREDTGRVWDVREQKWLDAYFKLTEAQVADGAKPELLHTIGLGERRAFTNRADNLALKIDVIHRLIDGAHARWPEAKILLAGWDFFGTWHSEEVRKLFETLDPKTTMLWDYEGDSPLKRYGNVTEWGVKGRFPYTYGFFINSAAGCDIRTEYDFIERRGRELVDDPFCRGLILWPEASHIDPFLLEWFTANAWRPFQDRDELLREFCRGRYGDAAEPLERIWRTVLASPVSSFVCWGGNLANRRPWDVVSFPPSINSATASGWDVRRELPRFAFAPRVLRDLALVPLSSGMVRRDVIDLARVVSDRLVTRLRGELIVAFNLWREGRDVPVARVEELARAYAAIGTHFSDLLEQHTDYSLYESYRRLEEIEPIANTNFWSVLVQNATTPYCRSHQYETARYRYEPCMRSLAEAILAKTAANDRTPLDHKTLDANGLYEKMQKTPLETMGPVRARTDANLRRTLLDLSADAVVALAEPPVAAARDLPEWFRRGTVCRLKSADAARLPAAEALGANVICAPAGKDDFGAFVRAAHGRGLKVLLEVDCARKAADVLCELVRWTRDTGVDGFRLVSGVKLPAGFAEDAERTLLAIRPDLVLADEGRTVVGDQKAVRAVRAAEAKEPTGSLNLHFGGPDEVGALLAFGLEGVPSFREGETGCPEFVRKLAGLRRRDRIIAEAPFSWLKNDCPDEVLSFVRHDVIYGTVAVVINLGDKPVRVKVQKFDAQWAVPYVSAGYRADGETVELAPRGYVMADVRNPF